MAKCKNCGKEYDVEETQRVFGDVPWTWGMCSSQCYTEHQKKSCALGFKCECGNDKFTAHQQCYHDIIVDNCNSFQEDKGIYESNTPYGPYECTECDKEYEELK